MGLASAMSPLGQHFASCLLRCYSRSPSDSCRKLPEGRNSPSVPNADIAEPTPSGDTQKFLALSHRPNVLVQAEQVERVVFLF
jgi:hypothetical protein